MSTTDDELTTKQLNLSKQYLNEETADVFFMLGQGEQKERIPAHKFVLFTNSDVFDRMFNGNLPEKNEIEITDASAEGFRMFLCYFYFDKYSFDVGYVGEAMYLAKKYNIDEYFDACCEFLKENSRKQSAKHILIGYELAIAHELEDLTNFFKVQIINQKTKVFGSEYWRSISKDLLKHILQITDLKNPHSTKDLFDACMVWAEESCINANLDPKVLQNRRKQLGDCFELIQFGAMKRDKIVRCVTTFWDLFTPHELQRFFIMTETKHPIPVKRDKMIQFKIGEVAAIDDGIKELVDFTEELHFSPQARILLGGITVLPLFISGKYARFDHGTISVYMKMTNEQSSEEILLSHGRSTYHTYPRLSSGSAQQIFFDEAIAIEPDSNYRIQWEFTGFERPQYHKESVTPSEKFPFRILPETNSKMISELLYFYREKAVTDLIPYEELLSSASDSE